MKVMVTAFSILFLSACATIPYSSIEQDQDAKLFNQPPSGKSSLYIFRDETFSGYLAFKVKIDNQTLGESKGETYFYQIIDPGLHRVTGISLSPSVLTFEAIAGESYYIWQDVQVGLLVAGNELKMVSPERGKRGVLKSKRLRIHKPKIDLYFD